MASYLKFLIGFVLLIPGIAGYLLLPFPWDVVVLLVSWIGGGIISTIIFKRIATAEEIRADLKARLDND